MGDEDARESVAGRLGLWLWGLMLFGGPVWAIATMGLLAWHPWLQPMTVLLDGDVVTVEQGALVRGFLGGLMGAGLTFALSPLAVALIAGLKIVGWARRRADARERARYDDLVRDAAVILGDWKVEGGPSARDVSPTTGRPSGEADPSESRAGGSWTG